MHITVTAPPKKILPSLTLIALVIIGIGFLSIIGKHSWESTAEWISMFDLNTESNIPT